MEEIDARAVLGLNASASRSDIEAAYTDRIRRIRKHYEEARDHRTREKCERDRDALDEARRLLLYLEEVDRRQREEQERRHEENENLAAEQRQPEESERLAAEQREREENERLAAEQRQREEDERLAAEQRRRDESERLALEQRQHEENERLATEERQRDESERLATEKRQREERERLVAEERQREERERLATEKRQRQERERLLAEQRLREERERVAAEQHRREEQERLAAERYQREQQQRLAAEQRERAEQERLAAINRQREQKRRNATWLVIGAAVLILAAAIAAPFLWIEWQNKNKAGKLVLNTVPAKAAVFVDGIARGNTPLVLGDLAPGERHLRIDLKGYQEEQLVVVIEPGAERYFPVVTLVRNKESTGNVTPAPTSPAETPSPAPTTPVVTPAPTSPLVTPAPTSPAATPMQSSPAVTPAASGLPGERFPQTRLRILTETDVADLDYAGLRYAINEMYARHGAQFLTQPDIRKQFEQFIWYVPMPGLTLARIDREFSRIESQNRDLLSRLRDQKRPK